MVQIMLTLEMIHTQEKYKWLLKSNLFSQIEHKDLNDELTYIYCADDCSNIEYYCKVITFWIFDFKDLPINFYKLLEEPSSLKHMHKLKDEICDFRAFCDDCINYIQSKHTPYNSFNVKNKYN
jgi:hypothetical protein